MASSHPTSDGKLTDGVAENLKDYFLCTSDLCARFALNSSSKGLLPNKNIRQLSPDMTTS